MNKRGVIGMIGGIAILLIFLVVVLVSFFCSNCIFEKLVQGAAGISDWIGNSVLGGLRDKSEKVNLEIPTPVKKAYDSILSALSTKGTGPCISYFHTFPEDPDPSDPNKDVGYNDFTISLSPTSKGTFIQVINKKGIVGLHNTIEGILPCVVGEGTAENGKNTAKNFYDNYLDGTPCSYNCPRDYTIANIEFKERNKIHVGGDWSDFKKQNNLVYKTKEGYVCFIPTHHDSDCKISDNKLTKGCIVRIQEIIRTQSGIREC